MAHSIQEFEGKKKIFNDLDLLVVVLLVLKFFSNTPKDDFLEKVRKSWTSILASYGPGLLELELEGLIQSNEEKITLLNVLHEVKKDLSEYGDLVPARVLNGVATFNGVKFFDYQTVLIVNGLTTLEELLVE